MWTVSVLLEADRYKPSILNASEQMLTHLRKHMESSQSITAELLNFMKNLKLYHIYHQIYLLTPLRNSKSFCPSGIEKTRMTVPWGGSERCTEDDKTQKGRSDTDLNLLSWKTKIIHKQPTEAGALCSNCLTFSEAVASLVPLASKARAANGLSWAGIILAARWETNTDTS